MEEFTELGMKVEKKVKRAEEETDEVDEQQLMGEEEGNRWTRRHLGYLYTLAGKPSSRPTRPVLVSSWQAYGPDPRRDLQIGLGRASVASRASRRTRRTRGGGRPKARGKGGKGAQDGEGLPCAMSDARQRHGT